jgi:hypothetical protein
MVSMHSLCHISKLSQDLNSMKSHPINSYVRWLMHITISGTETEAVWRTREASLWPTLVYINHLIWLSVKEDIRGNTFLITSVWQASHIFICTTSWLVSPCSKTAICSHSALRWFKVCVQLLASTWPFHYLVLLWPCLIPACHSQN